MSLTAPLAAAAMIGSRNLNRALDPVEIGMDRFQRHPASARLEMLHTYDYDSEDAAFEQARTTYLGALGETALLVCTATVSEQPPSKIKDIVPIGVACGGLLAIAQHERRQRLLIADGWSGKRNRLLSDVRKNGVIEHLAAGLDGPYRPSSAYDFVDDESDAIRDYINRRVLRDVAAVEGPDLQSVAHSVLGDLVMAQTNAERQAYQQARASLRK